MYESELKGKTAIVTGPRVGIGQAIALELAKAGVNIVGVGNTPMPETKALCEEQGVRFVEMLADLSKPNDELFERIVSGALDAFGKVDILINNAGVRLRNQCLDYTEQDWDTVLTINVKSLFFLTQRVAREFVKQGTGGKVVNIASLLSFQGGLRNPAYASSKSAVKGLTMSLANEWAKQGINVNAIAPGYIATDATQALRDDSKRNEEIVGRIPAGRWGSPDDIAGPAVFLCTDAARYINGFTLAVDGGWLGR